MLFASRGRKVGPAIFDRRHRRLTQELIGYWSPALTGPTGLQLLDLSGQNNHCTLTNMDAPTDWIPSQYGSALDFDGSNDFASTSIPFLGSENRFSMSIWVRGFSGSSNAGYFLSIPRVSSGNNGFDMRAPSGVIVTFANTLGSVGAVSTGVDVRGSWNFLTATYNSGSVVVFRNGSRVGTGSISSAPLALDSRELNLGRFGSFGSFGALQIAEVVLNRIDFSIAEHLELFRLGPGNLGRPGRISLGIFEATIGFSILADTGSYTLSGLPIPLLYGRSIAADAASILLQGQTTPLRLSRLLSADPRSYQFSGVDAGILLGRLLDAGAAAYTVDGTSAGFLASRRISAESVAYLASGQDAAFLRSRILQAGTGQYILIASPIDIQTGTGGAAPYYYLFLLGGSR